MRMNRIATMLLSAVAVVAIGFSVAHANPIVVDSSQRKVQMIAEDVLVKAGDGYSIVTGHYKFKQLPAEDLTWPNGPGSVADHILIRVPVFLPMTAEGVVAGKEEAKIEVRLNKTIYKPVSMSDKAEPIVVYDKSEIRNLPELPKDWGMVGFPVYIPLSEVGTGFELEISYRQPHFSNFSGRYSAYCAIIKRPTDDRISIQPADFTVSFKPMDGHALELVTPHKYIVTNSKDEIVVHPDVGLDDIVVKVR
jgi:hypothetical protein